MRTSENDDIEVKAESAETFEIDNNEPDTQASENDIVPDSSTAAKGGNSASAGADSTAAGTVGDNAIVPAAESTGLAASPSGETAIIKPPEKKEKKKKDRKKHPRLKIRTHLFAGFAVFVVVIVAMLWVFQIGLLNSLYRVIRKSEVKSTMTDIVECINDQSIDDTLLDICRTKNIEVMITNEDGDGIYTKANGKNYLFDFLTPTNAEVLYTDTVDNGGEQSFTLTTTQSESTDDLQSVFQSSVRLNRDDSDVYLFMRQCTLQSGEDRLIVLAAALTPIDSTLMTLKVELWIITGIMIILSGLLAVVLSRRLSKPIEAINSSAKVLATGNYDQEFTAKGSKEIAELADTLNYTRVELSKVDSLRRELIANVSHDLRTPLTMIKGFSEVMRDIPGENSAENCQVIIDETERLTSLVNDMLDISKLEAGAIKLDRSMVNITNSTKAILHRYDKLADYHFIFNYDKDVYVDGDELKLSQVIYNLVNNAITYTGADKTITIDQTVSDGKVTISVSDSGEGIPADKLPYIWDRYYKVDKAHKRAQRGTGLGLSIVKKIVDLHGGTYGVNSTEGIGSTFWFTIDTIEPEKAE